MDAIHYKVRENHQVITKAGYVVLGINEDGCKDVLGLWVGASESAKYWMGVLNELKSRGVKDEDVSLFCVDGLTVFREARLEQSIQKPIYNVALSIKYEIAQSL